MGIEINDCESSYSLARSSSERKMNILTTISSKLITKLSSIAYDKLAKHAFRAIYTRTESYNLQRGERESVVWPVQKRTERDCVPARQKIAAAMYETLRASAGARARSCACACAKPASARARAYTDSETDSKTFATHQVVG
eukprot:4112547-Pleurochrysis_carterae.AAC.3